MGEVWLVRDHVTGETVSLKQIAPQQVRTPIGQRLRREFLHLQQLRHPSILHVRDFGISSAGEAWFTSEVLRGPSSTDLSGNVSLQRWWELSSGFLRALSFMHRNDWIHGDIKPDNVRLRSPETNGPLDPVLLDLGLSRREHFPAEEKILGTPHTMAPEQWLGQPPDRRSDIYSAGVLLYHWWTGYFPFEEVSKPLLSSSHLHDEIPSISKRRLGLPPQVCDVLLRMLSKKPDDRYADGGEVLADLSNALGYESWSEAENSESLIAQVSYAGTGEKSVSELLEPLLSWVGRRNPEDALVHLHEHDADRRWIVERATGILQASGVSVISLGARSEEPLSDLSQKIGTDSDRIVVLVEDPDLGNPEWQRILQIHQWKNSRLLWWVSSRERPSGFIGQALSLGTTVEVATDTDELPDLEQFLQFALPGCSVPSRLLNRLQSWGQGQPGLWRRILTGRIRSGELGHDGVRWIWQDHVASSEDRWRIRSQEQLNLISTDSRRILESLAVLGRPATVTELSEMVQLPSGDFPARVAKLAAQKWLRVGRQIDFIRAFQRDAVLACLSSTLRQKIHGQARVFEHSDPLETAQHQLSFGDLEAATQTLSPILKIVERPMATREAARWVPVISSLIHLLPNNDRRPWLELLGQLEDRLGHVALRDHAWRQAAAETVAGSRESLRLTRWRAAVQRRDGEVKKALACIEEVSRQALDFSSEEVVEEAILVALEYSRIQRSFVRQGLGKLSKRDPLSDWVTRCRGDLRTALILEQCRRYLLQGSRLRARDHARHALKGTRDARMVSEAMCLLARAQDDLPSLRLWSRLHGFLSRREHRHEAATAAEVDAVEALQRMGESPRVAQEVHRLIDRARKECPAQLPRALMVKAREEAGAGFIRSAARDLEEAMSLEGPAGIVAWEGNLLVAASEWVAGRSQTALRILEAATPEWAPHEPERIDVHARHSILKSRCLRSLGDLSGCLFVIDHALTQLRLRGTDRDLFSLRMERVALLKLLGRESLARMEQRKLRGLKLKEPGLDPEPNGARRAVRSFQELLRELNRTRDPDVNLADDWESRFEAVALDALRLRIQPLSVRIQLAKNLLSSHADPEMLARQSWKKVVRLESREGRAMVLDFWAGVRRKKGDLAAARVLQRAAEQELDRWCQKSPQGSVRSALAEWLGMANG